MISVMRSRIPLPEDRPWRVLGLMSGTSADGLDAVLVEVDPDAFPHGQPFRSLLGHHTAPYPEALRNQVLEAASNRLDPAGLCILQRRLGETEDALAEGDLPVARQKLRELRRMRGADKLNLLKGPL